MYSSSLRTTYGFTLRGPASRLMRTSPPSVSSCAGCISTGTFNFVTAGTGATAAAAARAAGLGGTFGAVVLRGAVLAFAADLAEGFTEAFTEAVFLALTGLLDSFCTGIYDSRSNRRTRDYT